MGQKTTLKIYFAFMVLLPLLFYKGISDTVLLPRQLLLTMACALFAIAFWSVKKSEAVRLGMGEVALVVFIGVALVGSMINAHVFSESLLPLSRFGIEIAFLILVVQLLKREVISARQLVNGVIVFAGLAVMTAVVEIAVKTLNGDHLFRRVEIIAGNFANKNLLSSILFLCLPFLLIASREKDRSKWISRVLLVLTLLVLVIIRTRTVLVATALFWAIIVFAALAARLKGKVWWMVGSIVVVCAGLWWRYGQTLLGLQSSPDIKQQYLYRILYSGTIEERMAFWHNSWQMVREYPFGVGLGNWPIYFPKYGLAAFDAHGLASGIATVQRPHNDFLWILCETGIIGFIMFALAWGWILVRGARLIKTAGSNLDRNRAVSLFAGLIGFSLIAFLDFPLERVEHGVLLMLMFAMVIHYGKEAESIKRFSVNRNVFAGFIVAATLFSYYIASDRFNSEQQMYGLYAARTVNNNDGSIVYCEKAENRLYQIDRLTIPVQWYLGTAYFAQGRFDESEACFENAYRLTPYSIQAINNLASVYEVKGKHRQAIALYQKALRISPAYDEARLNLAAAYFNSKQFAKAFKAIDRCDVKTQDPKYRTFLPAILKAEANRLFASGNYANRYDAQTKSGKTLDYLAIYIEAKQNKVTFEKQIVNHLNNTP